MTEQDKIKQNTVKLNAKVYATDSGYAVTIFINEGLLKAAFKRRF
jgi:hypothetical protein